MAAVHPDTPLAWALFDDMLRDTFPRLRELAVAAEAFVLGRGPKDAIHAAARRLAPALDEWRPLAPFAAYFRSPDLPRHMAATPAGLPVVLALRQELADLADAAGAFAGGGDPGGPKLEEACVAYLRAVMAYHKSQARPPAG